MNRLSNKPSEQRGVTLMELLIVVVIVGVLGAVAYPSYTQYIINTKRAVATSAVLQIADRQQQFFMDNKTFADDITDLGLQADPYVIADDGRPVAADDGDAVYSISLSNVGVTTYTITATPLNGQLKGDTDCGSLSLNQAGVRGASGGATDCW